MRGIVLVGFMGAGKSTVARIVADRLGLPCVDLDNRIEQRAGVSVSEIFSAQGEPAFREMESAELERLLAEPPSVIATGGGVVVSDANRALLHCIGRVVYLRVSAAEAVARIGDAATRPLLAGAAGTLAATSLLDAREALYRASADVTLDTVGCTPEEVAVLVVSSLEEETS